MVTDIEWIHNFDEYVDKTNLLNPSEVESRYGNITFKNPDGTVQNSFHLRDVEQFDFPFDLEGGNMIVIILKDCQVLKHEFESRLTRDRFIKYLSLWGYPLPDELQEKPGFAKRNEVWIRMDTFNITSKIVSSESGTTKETSM